VEDGQRMITLKDNEKLEIENILIYGKTLQEWMETK
jgi:hypothetical protein